ncbi:hypothetical protein [Arthrobacter caoxuetaonis]|uniref:Uncharacterized protein n=1 Tax=Arthrobacter caoxuetaonis TaxID=2886935 RepID=A0A9X1MIR8_9MICC|nr:hypothetical protein [Arthrobacter caoxuetaonis]MCC3299692.1 hypothetical protein [Arthrobacter caoxuetaonis]USQ58967.1 hypothetical protein NF551_17830 [Arthrobacter caoxuetaonis]
MPIIAEAPLPDYIVSDLPGEEKVLGHSIPVNTDRWQKELALRDLPPLEGKLSGTGWVSVSRRDVLELGSREITPENVFQLHYYSYAWGLGNKARNLPKRLDGIAKDQERAADLLLSAWTAVRGGEPAEEVYGILTTPRGGARITWFGPAFSTKFLYFAQGISTQPHYVILDETVASNLSDVWEAAPTDSWYPDAYGRYCTFMSRWADLATEQLNGERKVRADEIEYAVFKRR